MLREVVQKRQALVDFCCRYRIRRLRLFGSAATGAFAPEASDLDFVAEFADTQAADYADRYLDFAEALERLFNRRVDVITPHAIRNPYFRAQVERTAQMVYEDRGQEIPA